MVVAAYSTPPVVSSKAHYDDLVRQQVLETQYEAACNGGKRSRKQRSVHNVGRVRKRCEPAPQKSALVQPGAKRRKSRKVVRFVDARDLTVVDGFTIQAAAEAMAEMFVGEGVWR